MKTIKSPYLLMSFAVLIIEILIALYAKNHFIRAIFGDYLAVIFVFYFLASFLKISKNKIALLSLSISFLIEALQFIHILEVLDLEKYTILKIVFGTSFSWMDMLAYTIGALTVVVIHNFKKHKS